MTRQRSGAVAMTGPEVTYALNSPVVWVESYTPREHWSNPCERVRVEAELVAVLTRKVGAERAEGGTLHVWDDAGGVRIRLVAAP